MLATRESIDEGVHRYRGPNDAPTLPTAPASDLITPYSVCDVEKSPHSDIWLHMIDQEFGSLLQVRTFAPAPVQ